MKKYTCNLMTCLILLIGLFITTAFVYANENASESLSNPPVYSSIEEAGKALREGIRIHDESIMIRHNIQGENIEDQIFDAATRYNSSDPTGGDYIIFHLPSYGISTEETAGYTEVVYSLVYGLTLDQEEQLDVAVKQCLKDLGVEGKSEYRKIKLIYDYICSNVKYDTEDEYYLNYSAYGALIKKKAICQGYANLFYRLALEAGLDARIISGYGKGEGHAWNIVKIGDVYYNLDSTWDASWREGYRYFLQCDKDFLYHDRDEKYITSEFYRKYPMSSVDYGLDSVNLIAPSKVSVNLYGHDDIKVSWGKVAGAKGYYVYYTKPSWDYHKYAGSTTKTYYKVANLSDGAGYVFRISPYTKVDGKKYDSRHYKDSTKIYTLKKISTPKITKKGSKVKVKWTNISGETGYQISKTTKKNKTDVISTYKTTKGTYKYISAKKNKTYYYKVRAYKTVDGKKIYGPWSVVVKYKRK